MIKQGVKYFMNVLTVVKYETEMSEVRQPERECKYVLTRLI